MPRRGSRRENNGGKKRNEIGDVVEKNAKMKEERKKIKVARDCDKIIK